MDHRLWAYPFLKEESQMCDFEIASDELASMIGYAIHQVKHVKELADLVELVYHLNGSIRGRCGVDASDLSKWMLVYDEYLQRIGAVTKFVLPCGCAGASYLHVIRSKTKAVLRIAYTIDRLEKKVNPLVLDLLNLLANLLFLMCLHENQQEGVEETVFVSKSYDN